MGPAPPPLSTPGPKLNRTGLEPDLTGPNRPYRGDPSAGDRSGSAYIFTFQEDRNAWVQERKLVASDASEGDLFGYSVDTFGDSGTVDGKR